MSRQSLLFDVGDEAESPPFSNATTSKSAADSIKTSAATLRAQVFDYIRKQGSHGATDEEIQTALSMSGNTERPRRGELEKSGKISAAEQTRKTSSGRQAIVWVAPN